MEHRLFKRGDLLHFPKTGKFAVVIRESYTKRFMEAQDYEMESHGMGHIAGVYASAIDLMHVGNARRETVRMTSTFRSNVEFIATDNTPAK